MNDKKRVIAVVALLGFMSAGIVAAVLREKNSPSQRREEPPPSSVDGKGPVVIYYFHGHQRCAGCIRTEKMLGDAAREAFSEELKNGTVVFRPINVEDLANVDLVERFRVTARYPVIADEADGPGGPWQELKRLPGAPGPMRELLESVVRPMLEKRKAAP